LNKTPEAQRLVACQFDKAKQSFQYLFG